MKKRVKVPPRDANCRRGVSRCRREHFWRAEVILGPSALIFGPFLGVRRQFVVWCGLVAAVCEGVTRSAAPTQERHKLGVAKYTIYYRRASAEHGICGREPHSMNEEPDRVRRLEARAHFIQQGGKVPTQGVGAVLVLDALEGVSGEP